MWNLINPNTKKAPKLSETQEAIVTLLKKKEAGVYYVAGKHWRVFDFRKEQEKTVSASTITALRKAGIVKLLPVAIGKFRTEVVLNDQSAQS